MITATQLASAARRALAWNRPIMVLAAAMAVMAVVSVVGMVLDDRTLLGWPVWLKPFKFATSFVVYLIAWGWMTSLMTRQRRSARIGSWVVVVATVVEYSLIVYQAARGRQSHFNESSAMDTLIFNLMGASVIVIWLGSVALAVVVLRDLRSSRADLASRVAVRFGVLISTVGAGMGVLMIDVVRGAITGESTERVTQIAANGELGKATGGHSVGVVDGGPGIPLLGWSTTGGDLRVPHFIGMHALQLLPLMAIGLGLLATRWHRLRSDRVRARLIRVAAAGYAGVIGLLLWQAFRGQSLIAPDALTLGAFAVIVAGVGAGTRWALNSSEEKDEVPA